MRWPSMPTALSASLGGAAARAPGTTTPPSSTTPTETKSGWPATMARTGTTSLERLRSMEPVRWRERAERAQETLGADRTVAAGLAVELWRLPTNRTSHGYQQALVKLKHRQALGVVLGKAGRRSSG